MGTFVAGRYAGTHGGGDLGITETGYELVFVPKGEMINESDAYGMSLIEIVIRGIDVGLILTGLEYKGTVGTSGPLGAIWPWGGTLGTYGIIGRLGSAGTVSASVALTATAGTPAASAPTSLTAARSLLSPNSNVSLAFNSKLRRVPIRYDCLPSDSFVHFTTS